MLSLGSGVIKLDPCWGFIAAGVVAQGLVRSAAGGGAAHVAALRQPCGRDLHAANPVRCRH